MVGFEVTPATVIGFLTILGYSLYDTVVVFDKVRENTAGLAGGSRSTYSGAVNLAVNQTLVRSINTSIIALLPIGAYDPPSGREVHMNPEEALRAFVELGAQRMVPMHYGTFRLSYEPLHEPPERLLASAREQGLAERITIMTEGEPLVF